ncbi:MAG: serine/threonine protein kinase [Candidatus Obscuribacterales bacterium]
MNEARPEKLADRYEIIEILGRGALGEVFRAYDPLLKKEFAVKVLILDSAKEKDLMRFQQEAKVVSRLNHRNIVKVYNFGLDSRDRPYMVLELLEGTPLNQLLLEQKTIAVRDLLAIAIEIADAMHYAHLQSVVHRDLKPSNLIMLPSDAGYTPVVVDFGIAKITDQYSGQFASGKQTSTGGGIGTGTPYYMSPEQCNGKATDSRSDIYSLGCVIFECITGEKPFQSDSLLNLMEMHRSEPPPPVSGTAGKSAELLQDLIHKMMAKDPEERPESMEAIRQSLIQILDQVEEEQNPPEETGTSKPASGRADRRLIIAGVSILLLGTTGYFLLKGHRRHPPPKVAPRKENPAPPKSEVEIVRGIANPAPDPSVIEVNIMFTEDCDDYVAGMLKKNIAPTKVFIYFSDATDRSIEQMLAWPLTSLKLRVTDVSDEGLKMISRFPAMRVLRLIEPGPGVTPRGYDFLPECKNLTYLFLTGKAVDNTVLETISRCPRVDQLYIEHAIYITDDGLQILKDLKSLKYVRLFDCGRISARGLARLRKARPDLTLTIATATHSSEE